MSSVASTGVPASASIQTPEGWAQESEWQRENRNLTDLLQELRVAGLGVQVLFGFLLALPFSARFSHLDGRQEGLYVATLLLAACATALLGGPVAYHRWVFRRHDKGRLLRLGNLMVIWGLGFVGAAISTAVLLVVSVVDRGAGAVVPAIFAFVVAVFVVLWFVVPILGRRTRPGDPTGDEGPS